MEHDYQIVSGQTMEELEKLVNLFLSEEYVTVGGICPVMIQTETGTITILSQALVKRD